MMMLMNEIIVYVALVLTGLALGSFAGASVWRLRARQLESDKKHGDDYDPKEYKRLKKLLGKKVRSDRSRCLECGYELKWYDLIPLVSWISLGGKCRSCKHPIGKFEPLIELGVAAFFVLSYMFWPSGLTSGYEIAHFVLWLAAGVVMAMLFAYDAKWYLLPDRLVVALAVIGLAIAVLVGLNSGTVVTTLLSAVGAVGVLAGLYAVLYGASRGRWVGFGDVKLGVGLGLLLISWELAFVALFLANFIGCLIVIPLMLAKKLKRTSRIPFGPLLIMGTILAWFVGTPLLAWYLGGLGLY